MPITDIDCPSGLTGRVRGLKTREMNLLASQKALRSGEVYDRLLSTCFIEVANPGPYVGIGAFVEPKNGGPKLLDWSRVLLCDRFYTLLQIRRATFGPTYPFALNCPRCRRRFEWELDLGTQLPVKKLPDASREKIAGGSNEFEVRLDLAGKLRTLRFRLQDGAGEQKTAEKADKYKERLMTIAVAARIIAIEGVEPSGIHNFVDDLDMQETIDTLHAFDEVDGGIDTLIHVVCTHCASESAVQLPFGPEFFIPSRKSTTGDGD
jgi:hypothetical protein